MITIECNKLFLAHGTSIHKLRYPIDATPFPPSLLYRTPATTAAVAGVVVAVVVVVVVVITDVDVTRWNHQSLCQVSIPGRKVAISRRDNANRKTRRVTLLEARVCPLHAYKRDFLP